MLVLGAKFSEDPWQSWETEDAPDSLEPEDAPESRESASRELLSSSTGTESRPLPIAPSTASSSFYDRASTDDTRHTS